MDRIQRSHDEAARLRGQPLSEITPSRRDFAQYVAAGKDAPAIIARVTSNSAEWQREQLLAHAIDADDADVAALSVSLFDDLAPGDLAAISGAVTAPILREDPLLDSNQLYHTRLHGADAVILPAGHIEAAELTRLVDVAVSMHMSVIVECDSPDDVTAALRWPYTIIGVADLATGRGLTDRLPATRTVVLLSAISTRREYEGARGVCDAVIVGPDAIAGGDMVAALRALQGTG